MTTPQPKTTLNLPYEVAVYRTRTGEVVGWIPFTTIPDWQRGLNIAGAWTVYPTLDTRLISKEQLTAWTVEWDWSWAICQGTHIWQAGPVKGESYSEDGANSTQVYGVGLMTLLTEKRVLVNAARTTRAGIKQIDADVAFGPGTTSPKDSPIPVANRNLALATIIKRIFENALAEPGGDLPIDLDTVDYTADNERTYPGYELGTPGGRAFDITQVNNGPEMELVPRFTSVTRKFVRHRLMVGTPANNGRLGQLGYPHTWDSGRGLRSVGFERTGEARTTRHWEKGGGSDRNVITAFAEDLTSVTTGPGAGLRPLLETVGNTHTNDEAAGLLQSYADSALVNGSRPKTTLSVEVRMDGSDGAGSPSGSPRLQAVSPGDTAVLNISGHRRLPNGRIEVRILRMSSTREPDRARLETQVLSGGFS
jgi:hypothetical protein